MADNRTRINTGDQIPSSRQFGRTGEQLNQPDDIAAGSTSQIRRTVLNTGDVDQNSEKPIIGAVVGSVIELRTGDQLSTHGGDLLTVQHRIGEAKDNGEADIFLCCAGSRHYERVIKIFRRTMRNIENKLNAFRKVDSEYIAPIVDTGYYADRYYEVYRYYPCGSLADEIKKRTFSYEELVDIIIPQFASALKSLHEAGIYHRDIKPSNILWRDHSKKSIVLIDFGLSSVIRDTSVQSTVLVSQIGGTRAYEAPEVHDGLYTKESDYYSMGIVLYELFCGKLPVAVYTNRITRPEGMPEDLHNLILGLTYTDISNRNDERNPNRRWTIREIVKWQNHEELPIPGTVQVVKKPQGIVNDRSIPPFSFQEKTYTDIDSLCNAFAIDWENGKKTVMREMLNKHLDRRDKTDAQALWMSQMYDIMNNDSYDADQKFLRIIMALSPNRGYIACPMGCFSSIEQLGKRLAACMTNDSQEVRNAAIGAMKTLLTTDELSGFAERQGVPGDVLEDLKWFETLPQTERWGRQREAIVCELAYRLSGDTPLNVGLPDGTVFTTVDELKSYLIRFGKGDFKELYNRCGYFLDSANQMKPCVYGWLRHQGCQLTDFNL